MLGMLVIFRMSGCSMQIKVALLYLIHKWFLYSYSYQILYFSHCFLFGKLVGELDPLHSMTSFHNTWKFNYYPATGFKFIQGVILKGLITCKNSNNYSYISVINQQRTADPQHMLQLSLSQLNGVPHLSHLLHREEWSKIFAKIYLA